jgi:glutamine amidotransferase
MTFVIGVIDYRAGNSRSVVYALDRLSCASRLVSSPDECADVDRFVLPGVGSAGMTMETLTDAGWPDFLAARVLREKAPFLGICVGLQVLFEWSEEHDTKCLGWLPGSVRQFDRADVRVPQIGWNTVTPSSNHAFADAIEPAGHFYFVNSYYAIPGDGEDVAGKTSYGVEFAAVVARRNIMATQFHVEKSGPLGLRLLHRFATIPGESLC